MKMNKSQNLKSIPTGYKQTEVGIIPEDWKVSNIGDLCVIFGRIGFRGYTKADIVSQDQGVLSISPSNIIGGRTSFTHGTYITRQKYEESPEIKIYEDDILLVKTGSTYGKIALVKNLKEDATLNPQVVVFKRLKSPAAFLAYIMQSDIVQNQIEETIVGGAIPTLSQKVVLSYKIPLPTPREQLAIANVLSDTDALIIAIEQLIAKKKDIKTATMQQLLTGRTRLAQFAKQPNETLKGYKTSELGMIPEDWEAKPFGELFESSLHRRTMRKEDIVSFVGMQDVSENAQLIEQSQLSFSEVKGGFTYFEKGDVLVAKITPCFENGKGCHTESLLTDIGFGSTEFHVLRAKNSSHSKFIYYWTTNTNLRKVLESEMVGSAGHRRVPLSAIQNYLIPCPQTKIEQTAIATILSDMDDELEALEQKLAKVRDIKQGMMQQLLTGRIRLPLDHQP